MLRLFTLTAALLLVLAPPPAAADGTPSEPAAAPTEAPDQTTAPASTQDATQASAQDSAQAPEEESARAPAQDSAQAPEQDAAQATGQATARAIARATTPGANPAADLHFQRSLEHLQAARADSAIADLLAMLRHAPDDLRGHRALVRVHASQERLWESYRIFEDLHQRYPRLTAPLITMGEIEMLRGRPVQAALRYEEALVLEQNDPAIMGGLAHARVASKQATVTLGYFNQLLAVDPRSVASRYGKAIVLAGQGEFRAAATQFKWAITLGPDCWQAERDYGRMLALDGKLELAGNHLARSIEILEAMNDPATAGDLRYELLEVRTRQAQAERGEEERD